MDRKKDLIRDDQLSPSLHGTTPATPQSMPELETLVALARKSFFAWERLRIFYNVALGLLLSLLTPYVLSHGWLFITEVGRVVLKGGIVANILFFAGPMVETYLRWHGYQSKWIRWFLLSFGTLLTAALAFSVIGGVLDVHDW